MWCTATAPTTACGRHLASSGGGSGGGLTLGGGGRGAGVGSRLAPPTP